jgi:hypothetical protein
MTEATLIVLALLIVSMLRRRGWRHRRGLTLHHRLLVSGTVRPAHECDVRYRPR